MSLRNHPDVAYFVAEILGLYALKHIETFSIATVSFASVAQAPQFGSNGHRTEAKVLSTEAQNGLNQSSTSEDDQ
jgi:hypothetical protein